MNDRVIGMLVMMAKQKSNIYDWFVTYNHQSQSWNLKQRGTFHPHDSAMPITGNSGDNIYTTIKNTVNLISNLEVRNGAHN
jgi:hypothetical protein